MPDSAYKRILFEVDNELAIITLNRPERRNALDSLMVAELRRVLARCDEDRDISAVLLRGEGPDFCTGADLGQLQETAKSADHTANLADAMALGDLFIAMRGASVPIVAAVHGNTLAGGAGLASAADIIVASDNTVLGFPEVHLGFVPAMVTAMLKRALGEKKVFELITLGERHSAEEAMSFGLVARIFPNDGFAAACLEFAKALAARSGTALELCKRLLYGIDGMSFEDAIARGAEINVLARATPDFREGMRRFVEKQKR